MENQNMKFLINNKNNASCMLTLFETGSFSRWLTIEVKKIEINYRSNSLS